MIKILFSYKIINNKAFHLKLNCVAYVVILQPNELACEHNDMVQEQIFDPKIQIIISKHHFK